MTKNSRSRPNFEQSADTRLLSQHLREIAIGETATYSDLSSAISKPVTGGFPALQSALRYLRRNDAIVFGCIRGVGLKRLNDQEIIAASDAGVDRLRRASKREAHKLSCVQDFAALKPAEQLAHTARTSIFAAIAAFATDRAIRKVSSAIDGGMRELPIQQTLKAFAE